MKNNLRMILYVLAAGLSFILWQNWQLAQSEIAHQRLAEQSVVAVSAESAPVPAAASVGSVPSVSADGVVAAQVPTQTNDSILVRTDVLELEISLQGGTITRAALLEYPQVKDMPQALNLLKASNPARLQLQSGLVGDSADSAPNHRAVFSALEREYHLSADAQTLSIPLVWEHDGVRVVKTYTFKRGSYQFDLTQQVDNQSEKVWRGFAYAQLLFGQPRGRSGIGQVYTYTGAVVSTDEKNYQKIDLADIRKRAWSGHTNHGWIAMIQHYFLAAIVPTQGSKQAFSTAYNNGDHLISSASQQVEVAQGASYTFENTAYIGPKVQKNLQQVAPYLDKTVDYGFFFIIAQPMFYVLNFIHGLLGNWGWAIVLMTIFIKLLFFTPSAWAYKSMAKMRRLAPEMQRLKERYGEDRQAMSQAMMKLYRQEKVNPASGCVPMLLQIPFFIAFYWVLVESVELRHAPWLGWIQDLSARDPYFILPIINAALMFVQQKLNPPPADPMQQKIMMMLPLVFGFMFMWFPSGLVLYWTVSNAFSIVQQSIMNKRYGEAAVKAPKS